MIRSGRIRNPGRVAGLWYLLLIVLGPLRLIYIPSTLFVQGDATATVNNIAAHEMLFRLGIVAVDRTLALLVVIFGGVMPALIYFVGVVDDFGVLMVIRRADFLAVFDNGQRDALAMLFIKLRDSQNTAAELLWGIWLFPLAGLVYKSRFLPRFLGVWLGIGGLAWVALSLVGTLWPQYQGDVFTISQPATLCEIAFTLWLVIKGATPTQTGK